MALFNTAFLIDDDALVNFLNTKTISRAGIADAIQSFEHAKDALEMMAQQSNAASQKNIVFLDINMPEMDGWQFLERFEQLPQKVINQYTIIMLSSSIDPDDIAKSKTYKTIHSFISKPMTSDKLQQLDILLRNS